MNVAVVTNGVEREVALDLDPDQETVGALLAAVTGQPLGTGGGLLVDGRFVEGSTIIADAGLRQGSRLAPAGGPRDGEAAAPAVEVRITGGLEAGLRIPLGAGTHVLGRQGADVVFETTTVSPTHARLDVDASGAAVIADAGSKNGTAVEGYVIPKPIRLEPGQVFQVGAVQLSVAKPSQADVPLLGVPRRNGTVTFNRPPRSVPSITPLPLRLPSGPKPVSAGIRFNMIQVAIPLVMAVGIAVIASAPQMLAFGLLSPAMVIANYMQDRKRVKKETAAGQSEMEQTVEGFRRAMTELRLTEVARRRERYPDPAEVIRRATAPSTRLWERRPGHHDFLQLSLGVATIPWTPPLENAPGVYGAAAERPAEVDAVLAKLGNLPLTPVSLDLAAGHTLGVVGERPVLLALLRSLVCQAAVHHGPADLRIAILTEESRAGDWDWAKWLPHTASLDESSGRRMLAASPQDVEAVLSELLEPGTSAASAAKDAPSLPVTLVVIDAEGLTEGRNARARELLGGAGGPVAGLVVARSVDRLPAVCTSIAELTGAHGVARYREPSSSVEINDILIGGVREPLARQCARALSSFEDPEVADPGADLPDRAALIKLLDLQPTPDAVLERWRRAGTIPRLSGPIGVAESGTLAIDLIADGPHALIAGTTGAGKSELLRTMVASWAASTDPEHLNFVLVDYKGGSAFAQCATLPHTVGMVTDLDEHLGQRALRCLEAELRYREHRLREAGASDLKEYLAQGHPDPLPRLVVIIDEFATMVAELPDFIDSLVGVAQRGRSLGVHMILATQRPGGAVNNNIRANTNLRISLRVQDVAESVDVLGSPMAAAIGRYQAGRGYLRLGPGEVFPFQTALVTGTTVEQAATGVHNRPFEFGPEPRQAAPAPAPGPGPADDVPSDLEKLVAAAAEAAVTAGMRPARRPWPEPLPEALVLESLGAPGGSPLAVPIGLADDPDHQTQLPFAFDPAQGNLLCYGVSGSGTTTALGTLAVSLARTHPIERLHIYVLDFGTQALAPLADLPHVGAVVGSADKERQSRLIRFLSGEIDRRRQWVAGSGSARLNAGAEGSPFPMIVLLLDNFSAFTADYQDVAGGAVREQFGRLVADGPGLGIVVVTTADRPAAIPASISNLVPQKLVFRLGEAQDFSFFGIPAREVPKLGPGRAIDIATRLEVQVALPGAGGLAAEVAAVAASIGALASSQRPPAIGVLPEDIKVSDVDEALSVTDDKWFIPLGFGDTTLAPVGLTLHEGEHVLVAGPARSGKSTTLDAIAAMVAAHHPEVVISAVALRRSPLREAPEIRRLAKTQEELDTVAQELLADTAPQLLLIDDCDSVEDPRNLLARVLSESRADLHVIAAGRADGLRSAYGHWSQGVRRSRLGLALKPDVDRDGDLWGASLPRRGPTQWTAGRGYLVMEGEAELTQAARR